MLLWGEESIPWCQHHLAQLPTLMMEAHGMILSNKNRDSPNWMRLAAWKLLPGWGRQITLWKHKSRKGSKVDQMHAPSLCELLSYTLLVSEMVKDYLLEIDAKISADVFLLKVGKLCRFLPPPNTRMKRYDGLGGDDTPPVSDILVAVSSCFWHGGSWGFQQVFTVSLILAQLVVGYSLDDGNLCLVRLHAQLHCIFIKGGSCGIYHRYVCLRWQTLY